MRRGRRTESLEDQAKHLELLASMLLTKYSSSLGSGADLEDIEKTDEVIKRVQSLLKKLQSVGARHNSDHSRATIPTESEWLLVWANVQNRFRSFQSIVHKVLIEYRVVRHWQEQTASLRQRSTRSSILRESQWRSVDVDDWRSFSIFHVNEKYGQPLVRVFMAAWLNRGLTLLSKAAEDKVAEFVTALERKYESENNPYHNSLHAADVVQACFYFEAQFMYSDELSGYFTEIDALALYVAAAIHDVGHPGLTNDFLVKTRSDLALRYNDKSVLENHHASVGFIMMRSTDCNLLDHSLPSPSIIALRGRVIEMVLSTDMLYHKPVCEELTVEIRSHDKVQDINKLILERCLLKAADIGHALRTFQVHEVWSHRLQTEFFAQGDQEKAMGYTPMALLDRDAIASFPKGQLGFINFVVMPLWRTLVEVLGPCAQEPSKCLEENISEWEELQRQAEASQLAAAS